MLEQDKLFHIKIGTLIEILKKEIVSGFSDATVVGGVDKFLLKNALQLKPVLGNIKSYSRLDQSNRKQWIDLILKNLTSYDSLDFAYRSKKFRMEFLIRWRSRTKYSLRYMIKPLIICFTLTDY